MDITGYVDHLRADLLTIAAAGDEAVVEAAERLATTLDSAVRMALLEALSDAAAEITGDLDGVTVEVRLKGREPQFVVTAAAPAEPRFPPPDALDDVPEGDEGETARITLRLPEALKQRAEQAAGRTRQSLNTWLVEAVRAATRPSDNTTATLPRDGHHRLGQHLSGWAR